MAIGTNNKLWPTLFVCQGLRNFNLSALTEPTTITAAANNTWTKLFMAVICQGERRRKKTEEGTKKYILQYAIFEYNFYFFFARFLYALVKEESIIANSWTGKVHSKLINSTIFYSVFFFCWLFSAQLWIDGVWGRENKVTFSIPKKTFFGSDTPGTVCHVNMHMIKMKNMRFKSIFICECEYTCECDGITVYFTWNWWQIAQPSTHAHGSKVFFHLLFPPRLLSHILFGWIKWQKKTLPKTELHVQYESWWWCTRERDNKKEHIYIDKPILPQWNAIKNLVTNQSLGKFTGFSSHFYHSFISLCIIFFTGFFLLRPEENRKIYHTHY